MPEPNDDNRELSLWAGLFTVFLCTLFGANAVAIKISFVGIGTFSTAAIRFAMAAAAVALWAKFTAQPFGFPKNRCFDLLVIACLFTAQLSLFYMGLSMTNASRGTLLANLQPFFTLVLAHLFIPGDNITGRKVAGILMGFSGVAFVFMEKKGIAAQFRSGDIMVLCAAFLWACNAVYVKRVITSFQPFHMVFYPMVFSVPFFFAGACFWDPKMIVSLDTAIIASVCYQGLVTASFGFVAWTNLLRRHGAVALHSFLFIMPVSGVILGGLMLKEPITPKILIALLFITGGIVTVHFKPQKRITTFFLYRG